MPPKSLVARLPRALALVASAASASLLLASSASANWIAPEHGGSPNADATHSLYLVLLVAGLIVFFAVEGLIVYTLWRFRASRGHEAKQIHGNTALEIGWTAGAGVLVVVLAIVSFLKLGDIRNPPNSDAAGFATTVVPKDPGTNQKLPPNGKALHVRILGFQYGWQFAYDDGDGNESNDVIAYRDLHVPTNTTVLVSITSRDVIHSWWIPELGGKFDAVNGFHNWTWFKIPAAKAGAHFRGQCAELCGRNHANMTASVIAHTPADFGRWLQDKKAQLAESREKAAESRALINAGETLK